MLIQEQSIHSLDLSDVALEDENQKHPFAQILVGAETGEHTT